MDGVEYSPKVPEEQKQAGTPNDVLNESWSEQDDEQQEATTPSPEEEPSTEEENLPTLLSSPETAPSVTPQRKQELLLLARADRLAWIQRVPLPYRASQDAGETEDPWTQDTVLSLVKNSNAVESLCSIPDVLSSLYGMEQGSSEVIAERIQKLLQPLGMTQEDVSLATSTTGQKACLVTELSHAQTTDQRTLLQAYQSLLTKLQTPECATLVQGMRTFCRSLSIEDEMSSLHSYIRSTYESIKTHPSFRNATVDDTMLHALESFLYGQCHDAIETVLKSNDEEFLKRLQSLQFITPTHLEVASLMDGVEVDNVLQEPIAILRQVDSYYSPYEKLQCILKVYHGVNTALTKALNKDDSTSQKLPSADDVLPTLILTIVHSQAPNLLYNVKMIEVHGASEYLRGEAGYAYTNLYGALQFLLDLDLNQPSETLHITAEEFQKGLETCRASAESHVQQLTTKEEKQAESKEMDVPIDISVREIRAARLRGETVDLEWARRWQQQHHGTAVSARDTTTITTTALPDTAVLPSGFSRSYSYMVTRPEDVRISDLPQLLAEYRMLVHATEQLLGERTARVAAERKQAYATSRASLLERAAQVELNTSTRK